MEISNRLSQTQSSLTAIRVMLFVTTHDYSLYMLGSMQQKLTTVIYMCVRERNVSPRLNIILFILKVFLALRKALLILCKLFNLNYYSILI